MALNGIDLSSYQRSLDVGSVTADFVFVKATEGTTYVNPVCDIHFQEAKANNRKRGFYHFADYGNAISEADFFVDNCMSYFGDAIPALDWEGSFVADVNWAKTWLDHVYSRTGVKPLIYMSEWVENNYDWSSVVDADYGIWGAKYSDYEIDNNYDMSNAGTPPNLVHWPFLFIWQWTSKGALSGYAGDLDCDIAYGTTDTWDKYANVPVHVPSITTGTVSTTTNVPFDKQTVESPAFDEGTSQVTQAGVDGIETITYTVTYSDGVETGRVVASDTITVAPISEITTVGTRVVPEPAPTPDPAPSPTPQPAPQPSPVKDTLFTELAHIFAGVLSWLRRKQKQKEGKNV